ncbi:Tetraspanin-6 [Taenia crassiceps]|uniref:Tetraspanin n=1 Tax=Taenia crassiceps TaxID=6207 RepID=A0ABR4Q3J5_9CEST
MNCLLGCVRVTLAILNLLLFIVFTAVGILGFLLKFNSQFVYNLLNKATTKWPQKEVQDVVQFVQQYGSGLAIGFIILGLAVAIITLLGLFALLCNNRILVLMYTSLLAILSIAELALIIYLFAIPGNLDKTSFKFLDSSFEHLRTNDSLTKATHSLWRVLGSAGNKPCCGLNGYQDFNGMLPTLQYPPSCCTKNAMENLEPQPETCNKALAEKYIVEGCKEKVSKYLSENKPFPIGISCGVLIFQVLILLAMCVLYWKLNVEQ